MTSRAYICLLMSFHHSKRMTICRVRSSNDSNERSSIPRKIFSHTSERFSRTPHSKDNKFSANRQRNKFAVCFKTYNVPTFEVLAFKCWVEKLFIGLWGESRCGVARLGRLVSLSLEVFKFQGSC